MRKKGDGAAERRVYVPTQLGIFVDHWNLIYLVLFFRIVFVFTRSDLGLVAPNTNAPCHCLPLSIHSPRMRISRPSVPAL